MQAFFAVCFGLWASIGVYLYVAQDRFLLFPMEGVEAFPEKDGISSGEIVVDGKHLGFILRPSVPNGEAVVFYHGNAGNASHRWYVAEPLLSLGYTVVLYEYAGFGRREGTPNISDMLKDALADFPSLFKAVGSKKIFLAGESFGAAVAAQIAGANKNAVEGLLLITPWKSLPDLVSEKGVPYPSKLIVKEGYDSVDAVRRFGKKSLVVGAVQDDVIPFSQAEALSKEAGVPLMKLPDAVHNNWSSYFKKNEWRLFLVTP